MVYSCSKTIGLVLCFYVFHSILFSCSFGLSFSLHGIETTSSLLSSLFICLAVCVGLVDLPVDVVQSAVLFLSDYKGF